MMEALKIGKKYRFFLSNHFKYEGTLSQIDERFLTILDSVSKTERIIPINGIMNLEVV